MQLIARDNLKEWLEERIKNTVGAEHAETKRFLAKLKEEKVWFDLSDQDFGSMIVSIVRYTLGRQTYIVGDTCNFVRQLLPVLHPITLAVMERDIANAWSYGDEKIDKPSWMALLDDVTAEINKRKGDINA